MEKKYCVYVHTNKINGKKYVGQTCQKPEVRWAKGFGYLKKNDNGSYKNPHFAAAIVKWGWDNFEHEVVASNLTREEANNIEIRLIKEYKTQDSKYGYNICDGGNFSNGNKGKQFSDEWKRKIGDPQKGAKNHNAMKVNQYTKDGKFVKTWDCIMDAARALGIKNSDISRCCKGKLKSCGGFVWCYADEQELAA